MPPTRLRWARLGCAALLAMTAINHAVLASRGSGSVGRHELFIGLNLGLAVLLVVQPRWALFPTLVLSLQQLASHGSDLLESLRGSEGPVDWASAAVLVFFPALVTLLVVERRTAGTPEPPRGAPPGS